MVGIVIVSHSERLAEGVRELAQQMVQGKVPIAVAAGVDDPENPLGTDAIQVHQAIASIYSDDGVVVLMDLGSALMSAEMALEFLSAEQQDKVRLCAAPLVEGAIAAAVASASGCDIDQVIAEAQAALSAKIAQLGLETDLIDQVEPHGRGGFYKHDFKPKDNLSKPAPTLDLPLQSSAIEQKTKEIRLTISNKLGLHARPAAKLVSTAAKFQSQIRVCNLTRNTEYVRADSINQVAILGVRQGHQIAISAEGEDADQALAALQALIKNNFGEDHTTPHPSPPSPHHFLQGIPASPGIAIAPIFHYRPTHIQVQARAVDNVEVQWQRLQVAIAHAKQEIQALQTQIQTSDSAAIFDAHLLFLADPTLIESVQQRIFAQNQNAEFAWQSVIDELVTAYCTLEDPYMQERANDLIDVSQRVLRSLFGDTQNTLTLPQPSILVATDLTPSDTAQLDAKNVLGICTTLGSTTSHTAILARTLGIPALVGVKSEILNLTNGTLLAFDGENGNIWIEPDADTLATLEAKREAIISAQQQAQAQAQVPAITRDGKQVKVLANISGIADAQIAIERGAAGVGLLRTEFLYFDRKTAPTEDEQLEIYQAIAQILEQRPLIIRTLDIGGDKPLPYLNLPPETNPFLGWRGIRSCLAQPDMLKTQLRAILRASPGHQIKIMFPMIATLAEVQAAKQILADIQTELCQAGIPFDQAIEVGIMVEVPAAVAIADQLATQVDFFSIGTNDLSQYIMAADRTNPRVATLADALHPAVLRMIHQTVQAAHQAGIWVGICGELASDPIATPILLGLGIDEFSLNSQAIGTFKQNITQLTVAATEATALSAMQLNSATQVRTLVSNPPFQGG